MVPPTSAEVAAIIEAVDERFAGLVVLLAGAGLRIGEALGLDVEHVDFLRRELRIERQLLQDGTFGPPKTAKSRRLVPLAPPVVSALSAHLAEYPPREALSTDNDAKRLAYRRWRKEWAMVRKSTGNTDVDTHELRHCTASALISGGASVKHVQVFLGHSSAAITLRVYAHLRPGDDDRTRDVMEAALAEVAHAAESTPGSVDAPTEVLMGASG